MPRPKSISKRTTRNADLEELMNETRRMVDAVDASFSNSSNKRRSSRRKARPRPGRVTIEVLDDESSSVAPSTARSTLSQYDDNNEGNGEEIIRTVPSKDSRRKLKTTSEDFSFSAQHERLSKSKTTFIPSFTAEKGALSNQQNNLSKEVNRLQEMKQMDQEASGKTNELAIKKKHRQEDLQRNLAATKIQAIQRRNSSISRVQQIRMEKETLQRVKQQWRIIRNDETNEEWYYNTETGESQWEAPLEIQQKNAEDTSNFVGVPETADTISTSRTTTIDDNASTTTTPRPYSSASSAATPSFLPPMSAASSSEASVSDAIEENVFDNASLPALSSARSGTSDVWNDNSRQNTADTQYDTAASDISENSNLFLADGSRSKKLKNTIREQLFVNRFSSVSQLMASQLSPSEKKSRRVTGRNNAAAGERNIVLGGKKSSKYLVAQVVRKKKKKSKKSVNNTSTSTTNGIPVVRDVSDPGFDDVLVQEEEISDATTVKKKKKKKIASEKCFGCWISRKGGKCTEHSTDGNRMVDGADSVMLCTNWEVDQLRRKYRSEELQELFKEQDPSLRFDKTRKQWITIIESRHPIYRYSENARLRVNMKARSRIHCRAWFRSFLEYMRINKSDNVSTSTALLKFKTVMSNTKWCQDYSNSVLSWKPKPPITLRLMKKYEAGVDLLDQVYIDMGTKPPQKLLPTELPRPIELFRPRKYEMPSRKCVALPEPTFTDISPHPVTNVHMDLRDKAGWFERLVSRAALQVVEEASKQVHGCKQKKVQAVRTKYPKITTVRFASFGRKASDGMLAVGGLSAELTIHMLITTYVPPQFGNFSVMHIATVTPGVTKDYNASYRSITIGMAVPEYVHRQLEHSLNVRRAPGVTVSTSSPIGDLQFHGLNRPEQTGEEAFCGFYTTLRYVGLSEISSISGKPFVPSPEAMTPNVTSTNQTVTTHADRHYPFCESSTTANTVYEFIHLLWIGKSSRNQGQCFTNLGIQDPGEFMKGSNPANDMGAYISVVYRSWAYMQSSPYQEFVTDSGVAYWYDRRQGKTYWERPILDVEKHRGADGDIDGTIATGEGEKASLGIGAKEAKYSQRDIRKYMTKTIEDAGEASQRASTVKKSMRRNNIAMPVAEDSSSVSHKNSPTKIKMPQLNLRKTAAENNVKAASASSPALGLTKKETKPANITSSTSANNLNSSFSPDMIESITAAIGKVLQTNQGSGAANDKSSSDMLQLGIGLGMGLGLQSAAASSLTLNNSRSTENDDDTSDIGESDAAASTYRSLSTTRSTISDVSTVNTNMSSDALSATPTPDEASAIGKALGESREDHLSELGKTKDYFSHPPAGKGVSWTDPGTDTITDEGISTVHKSVARLPEGFVDSIISTKCVPMHADYLPRVVNMNDAKSVGVVKPRTVTKDWISVNYDPWSAGKAVFGVEFIPNLSFEGEEDPHVIAPTDGSTKTHLTAASKELEDIESLMSLCRHGKYTEIEEKINSPDWTLSIDAQDSRGNTLLSVACQNSKQRIAKLALRKGANINTQNLNGQTPLHFCYAYNDHDLAQYLIGKGADDSIVNADNLTCYEGLSLDSIA